jgi:hypothetical protein
MSLNLHKIGREVAVVKDNPKMKKAVFSVSNDEKYDENEIIKPFNHFQLPAGTFQYVPDTDRDRDTIFVAGTAGSGKSYWAAQYIREYHKIYPDNPIYLITGNEAEDPAFENMKFVKKINLEGILNDPLDYNEFKDCLVVFDDIDACSGKLGKYLYELRDKLLKNSRKVKVSVLSTAHSFSGMDLKSVLNESDVIVWFNQNYNRSLKYLLENYIGLTKNGIKAVRNIKSRWCCYIKSYPNVLISEKTISTLSHLQSEI